MGIPVVASDDPKEPLSAEVAKLQTEDAHTVPRGETEVELLYQYGYVEDEYDGDRDLVDRFDASAHVFSLTVNHGLFERFDFTFKAIGLSLDSDESTIIDDQVGNILLTVKWRFFEERRGAGGVALAWKTGITAPIGPAAGVFDATTLLPNFWSFDNLLALTFVKGGFNVSSDLGILLPLSSASANRDSIILLDVGAGYQVSRLFQPTVELSYAYDIIQGPNANASIMTAAVGAIFNVNDLLRVDAGFARGVVGRNQDALRTARVNVSLTF